MSLGRIVFGLASLALGAKHLSNGVKQLRSVPGAPQPVRTARPATPKRGASMQMRVYGTPGKAMPIETRIKHIQQCIAKGKVNPQVYAFARAAVSQKCGDNWCIPEKDNLREAEAVFKAIRKNVRYTSDILGIDTYQNPKHTLKLKTADCDDYSSTVCASLLSLGIPCRLVVIQTKDADTWNHIYAQAGFPRANPQRWVTMDASVDRPFGWEAPQSMIAAKRIFPAQ